MTIPFEIPSHFFNDVATGDVLRYGAILKDAQTGRIVAHVKEVGDLTNSLSGVLNNIGGIAPGINTMVSIGNAINTNIKLKQIINSLETLKMISSVGAVASVATLGVCAIGFSVVCSRIKSLEAKLSDGLNLLANKIGEVQKSLDNMKQAEIDRGFEILDDWQKTNSKSKAVKYLDEAETTLAKHRNYYFNLILSFETEVFLNPELSLAQIRELYAKYYELALGELHAIFYQGEWEQCNSRLKKIINQLRKIVPDNFQETYRKRMDELGIKQQSTLITERKGIVELKDFLTESFHRTESIGYEADYVKSLKISPQQYIKEINQIESDEGFIIIPAHKVA